MTETCKLEVPAELLNGVSTLIPISFFPINACVGGAGMVEHQALPASGSSAQISGHPPPRLCHRVGLV